MPLIKLTEALPLSLDGINVVEYDEGATLEAPLHIAQQLAERGAAEYVGGEPEPVQAPDAPPAAPASPDGDEDTQPEQGERPDRDAARKALDAYASTLGLDTLKLPNKAAVNDAIDAELAKG